MISTKKAKVIGLVIELSDVEARDLYSSLYHLCIDNGINSINDRPKHPKLKPLFDLYDVLNTEGFDS